MYVWTCEWSYLRRPEASYPHDSGVIDSYKFPNMVAGNPTCVICKSGTHLMIEPFAQPYNILFFRV